MGEQGCGVAMKGTRQQRGSLPTCWAGSKPYGVRNSPPWKNSLFLETRISVSSDHHLSLILT